MYNRTIFYKYHALNLDKRYNSPYKPLIRGMKSVIPKEAVTAALMAVITASIIIISLLRIPKRCRTVDIYRNLKVELCTPDDIPAGELGIFPVKLLLDIKISVPLSFQS